LIANKLKIQIVVMAYNRFEHTKKVLDGLEKENIEKLNLYIDAAKNDFDKAEQIKIKAIVSSYNYEIILIERESNLGLAKSITGAVTDTLKENDAVILLEDDCVPKHGFINYMYTMLNTYKDNKKIGSICGYMYPHIKTDEDDNEIFFINRFSPWGWATWADRWEGFTLDLKTLVNKTNENKLDIKNIGSDVNDYCTNEHFLNNEMDIWSLNWILQQYINNMSVIYPKISLIENIGFDGTGVHSTITHAFDLDENIYDCVLDFSLYGFEKSDLVYTDNKKQSEILEFLEQNSKMTYLLNS
jgi:hypothetical protein